MQINVVASAVLSFILIAILRQTLGSMRRVEKQDAQCRNE